MRSANHSLWLLAILGVAVGTAFAVAHPAPPVEELPSPSTPLVEVDRQHLARRPADGRIVHRETPFTGVAIERASDGTLVERTAYVDGLKEGRSERWYPDGTRSDRVDYRAGRRHGTADTWWEDGTLRSESRYVQGVADGVQRQWYRSGALFKEIRLVSGQEEGLQRAWRENGALYTNYQARDGRIYGLKRATLCYELDDEALVRTRSQP